MRKRIFCLIIAAAMILTLAPVIMAQTTQGNDFVVSGGTGYTYGADGVLTFTASGDYEVSMAATGTTTATDKIVVALGVSADITLNGVSINLSTAPNSCAFMIADNSAGNVTVILNGTNTLASGANCAGLQKNGSGAGVGTLTIRGNGSLSATGGANSAGIGGGNGGSSRYITIQRGTITAKGGALNFYEGGAGIGGGYLGAGSDITISGGNVTANGGAYSAGIGGGGEGPGSNITISGGTVTATGGGDGAGIGGGAFGDGSSITICGGTVTAIGSAHNPGSTGGAGIGGGYTRGGSNITISGGEVTATGGGNAAGIGRGVGGSSSNISIAPAAGVKSSVSFGASSSTAAEPAGVNPIVNPATYAYTGTDKYFHAASAYSLIISGGTLGTDYTYTGGVVSVKTGTALTISMPASGATTTDTIVVESGVNANITLDGVGIDASATDGSAAFLIAHNSGGTVTLTLTGENFLKSGKYRAGLQKSGNFGALAIGGTGSLTAIGGGGESSHGGGAGIGGGGYNSASDYIATCTGITINGGDITATGSYGSAGLGGGGQYNSTQFAHASHITINGGTVRATGSITSYSGGAGIGGGYGGNGSDISITGGTVIARGADSGAGIGGGVHYFGVANDSGYGRNISISGGDVTADGGAYAAGIGGGDSGSGSNISISGGKVTATGGSDGAGIGGGLSGSGSDISISGGKVTANGVTTGAGIGSAGFTGTCSNVTITGGEVTATGGETGAGIGGGNKQAGSSISIEPATKINIFFGSNPQPTGAPAVTIVNPNTYSYMGTDRYFYSEQLYPPVITITTQPADTTVTVGSCAALTAAASVTEGGTPEYAWYQCDDATKTNPVATGVTGAAFTIPDMLPIGTYYYFCRVSASDAADVDTNAAEVTVLPLPPTAALGTDKTVTVTFAALDADTVTRSDAVDVTTAAGSLVTTFAYTDFTISSDDSVFSALSGVRVTAIGSTAPGGTRLTIRVEKSVTVATAYIFYDGASIGAVTIDKTVMPGAQLGTDKTVTVTFAALDAGTATRTDTVDVTTAAGSLVDTFAAADFTVSSSDSVFSELPGVSVTAIGSTAPGGTTLTIQVEKSVAATTAYIFYDGASIGAATIDKTVTPAAQLGTDRTAAVTFAYSDADIATRTDTVDVTTVAGSLVTTFAYTDFTISSDDSVFSALPGVSVTAIGSTAPGGTTLTIRVEKSVTAATAYIFYDGASIGAVTINKTVTPPVITITLHPQDAGLSTDDISGDLTAAASVTDDLIPSYEWFRCAAPDKTGAASTGVIGATFTIPATLSPGTYYYFCRISATDAEDVDTDVAAVTVYELRTLISATADGVSGTQTSTRIDLVFDSAIAGLRTEDITITGGTGSAVKGTLTGSGTNWSIALTSVAAEGTVSVAISAPDGYSITGSPKTVAVYKAAPTPTPESATINPVNGVFNKNLANQADVQTSITWHDATSVTDVKAGGVSIGAGSYSMSGNTLTIKKEYLASQPVGNLVLSVEFNTGGPATLTIEVSDTMSITGLPTTYTMYEGGRVTWDPKPDGGTWDWDHSFFSATFNSPATFTALKAGTSVITYTVNGVSQSVTVAVREAKLPVTGQDFTLAIWLLIAGLYVGLCAISGFVVLRIRSRRKERA